MASSSSSSSSRLPGLRKPASSGTSRPMSMFEVPTEHLKRLNQVGDDPDDIPPIEPGTSSKQSMRRSLLPQAFSSRKLSPDETDTFTSIREDVAESDEARVMDEDGDKKAMPPPPLPKPRTTSMRPPATLTAGTGRTAVSHVRAGSRDINANGIPARTSSQRQVLASPGTPLSDIKRTGSARLPQSPGPRTSSQQASTTRTSANTNTSGSTIAQKRSSAIISKPPNINTSGGRGIPSQPSPVSPTRPTNRSQLAPPSKPSFSTYQQHYSPAKSALPKPPIPGTRSARSGTATSEAEPPITFDVALEQIELLQLTLLHQNAAQTLREYDESAKQKLGKMHARLKKEYDSINAREQESRRSLNLIALETWCPDKALLAEHLQTLGKVVLDMRGHTEPGSRHSELVQTFEDWAGGAEAILLSSKPTTAFIEALPESWRATHTSLALKLRSSQRDLGVLPPLPQRSDAEVLSSLDIMLTSCSSLVDSMLKELEVMTKLQKEVLQRGRARIDEQINSLLSPAEQLGSGDKENWQPAWSSLGA